MTREDHQGNDPDPDPIRGEWSDPRTPRVRIDLSSFEGSRPRELLERLLDGDPLDLALRTWRRRSQLAYLVSRERLFLRSVARAAYGGYSYRGTPPVDAWLEGRIDRSLEEILDEDESGVLRDAEVEFPEDYHALIQSFDLTPKEARSSCVAFNQLGLEVRQSFFALYVEGATLEQLVAETGGDVKLVLPRLEEAIGALLGSRAGGVDENLAVNRWPADW